MSPAETWEAGEIAFDRTPNNAARLAGFTALLTMAVVITANFGIYERLMVRSDMAETMRNIAANELRFRIAVIAFQMFAAGTLVVSGALYVILRPVNRTLALLAILGRLVYAFTWLLASFNMLTALRLIRRPEFAVALGSEGLQALVRLHLGAGYDLYYVGLLFYSVGSIVLAWLLFKSRFVPRGLAAFGVASYAWCAGCCVVLLLEPEFANVVNLWFFDTALGGFEVALSLWFIIKGVDRASFASATLPFESAGAAR